MWRLICVVRRSMKSWASLVVMSFMAEEASFDVGAAVASAEGDVASAEGDVASVEGGVASVEGGVASVEGGVVA